REVFQKFFDGAIESNGAVAVIDRKSGRVIGTSRYSNFNAAESIVEIGYTFLERAYWGGAYNGELKSLMLDHAFQFVDRVTFVVGEGNLRSQKALHKIGAIPSARTTVPGRDGTAIPCVVFKISRV